MKNFIRVYDALKLCNMDLLVPALRKQFGHDDVTGEINFLNKVIKLKPKRNSKKNVLFNAYCDFYKYDTKEYFPRNSFYTSVFEITQMRKRRMPVIKYSIEDLKNNTYEQNKKIYDYINAKTYRNYLETYAYEFCEPQTILSYYIPKSLIKRYGLEPNIACILYEMTFFGYDFDDIKSEQDSVFDTIDKAYEQITNNEVETTKNDEVKDESESFEPRRERTEEDQKELENEIHIDAIIENKETFKVYNLILEDKIKEGF